MSVENPTTPTPAAPVIGTPEYDASMAAKFDASQAPSVETPKTPETPAADAPVKPDWLPEKFWKDGKADYEGLSKSYGELEKTKPAKPADVEPAAAAAATSTDAAQALESVGLDYAAISGRFQEAGELAAADRAALNKAGVPDGMIDAYVAGQHAQANAFVKTVQESVGGEAKFVEMTTWAAKGLTPAELKTYNDSVSKGDAEAAKLAVLGLKSKFEAAMGADPVLLNGTNTPSVGSTFRSTAELTVAMSDPRYKSDAAYRNDVIQRLNRSSIL